MEDLLKVYLWNCRSLCSQGKLSLFKIILYSEKPHIVCLTETWLQNHKIPRFIDYTTFYKNRSNRSGGGVAILVRNTVMCSEIQLKPFLNGGLEICGVKIYSGDSTIDVLCCYNPGLSISKEEFSFYYSQVKNKFIFCGDFNAHHSLWNENSIPNTCGHNLFNFLSVLPINII